MALHALRVCTWRELDCKEELVLKPSWAEIETAIRELDGEERNDLYLQLTESDPETWLAVCGGSAGYFVTGSIENERFPTLVDAHAPDEPAVPLVVGGQLSELARNEIVSLQEALAVVRRVYDASSFDCGVDWQYR